jgi:hypothetical protein
MNSKIIVPIALIAAFLLGTAVSGIPGRAFNAPVDEQVPVQAVTAPQTFAPAAAPRARATTPAPAPVKVAKKRSWEKEVLIVGGSAGAGAAIGAVAGGKKGAAIGAVSGGVAGLVYDLATRNK